MNDVDCTPPPDSVDCSQTRDCCFLPFASLLNKYLLFSQAQASGLWPSASHSPIHTIIAISISGVDYCCGSRVFPSNK
eukprot:68473-Pleurochrysis_carterae.AAC.4